jgi:hypothetical protein
MSMAGEYRATLKSNVAALWFDRNPGARLRMPIFTLRLLSSIGKKGDSFPVCSTRRMRWIFHPVMAVRFMQAMTRRLRLNL